MNCLHKLRFTRKSRLESTDPGWGGRIVLLALRCFHMWLRTICSRVEKNHNFYKKIGFFYLNRIYLIFLKSRI